MRSERSSADKREDATSRGVRAWTEDGSRPLLPPCVVPLALPLVTGESVWCDRLLLR